MRETEPTPADDLPGLMCDRSEYGSPMVANDRKTERAGTRGQPGARRPAAAKPPPSERSFFDEWVDRRLKTMHDAVLGEKIPDDMLRMLRGDRDEADEPAAPDKPRARDER
jgi:hypothetical protein